MSIKAGDLAHLSDFTGSMAAAIEDELNRLLTADGLPALPLDDRPETRDRRRLFVAIARGVMRHLVENRDAVTIDLGAGTTVSPEIDVADIQEGS
jgi:hypothetical protein